MNRDAVLADARATTHRVARTFAAACHLLPRDLRDDVYRLYLVLRSLDDLVDGGHPDAARRVAAVERWAARTGGGPTSSEVAVLRDLTTRHPIPRSALGDFCAGMRFDLASGVNHTEADLDRYCYQVAGTVGLVMAAMLGARGPRAEDGAIALGMAMQRTNILRDVDEDGVNGRIYLAHATVARFGGSLAPGCREPLLRDQIARADALYERGMAAIPLLPRGRWAIEAAAAMYREILRQIERDGYGALPGRAVVAPRRKLAVAVRRVALVR